MMSLVFYLALHMVGPAATMLMPAAQTVKPPGTGTAQICSNFAQLAGLIPAACKRAWKIEAFYSGVRLRTGLPILRTALHRTLEAALLRQLMPVHRCDKA
jgi:hypothetical protein